MRRKVSSHVAASILALNLGGCEKHELDRLMSDLCAKDGGVRVHHRVVLPLHEFSADGVPLARYWLDPALIGTTGRLGPDYKYTTSENVIKDGNPLNGEGRLVRHVERVHRAGDGVLLGESVSYGRSGGDVVVIGHFSSATCPSPPQSLLRAVFVKEGT